jgi:hypothetical protein
MILRPKQILANDSHANIVWNFDNYVLGTNSTSLPNTTNIAKSPNIYSNNSWSSYQGFLYASASSLNKSLDLVRYKTGSFYNSSFIQTQGGQPFIIKKGFYCSFLLYIRSYNSTWTYGTPFIISAASIPTNQLYGCSIRKTSGLFNMGFQVNGNDYRLSTLIDPLPTLSINTWHTIKIYIHTPTEVWYGIDNMLWTVTVPTMSHEYIKFRFNAYPGSAWPAWSDTLLDFINIKSNISLSKSEFTQQINLQS